MDAIIMAGGLGSRLGMGEKPCVSLLDKPLITYVIDALHGSSGIDKVYVAVSPATPLTQSFLQRKYNGTVRTIMTSGGNYVGDMIYAVKEAAINEPVLIIMSDLPLLNGKHIDYVIEEYKKCGKPAMSVFSPLAICKELSVRPDTVFNWEGELIVPCGVNIIDGSNIEQEQDYESLICQDTAFALNINRAEDLRRCKEIIEQRLLSQS
ncbi:NTP transferase domain-containing protein [Methanomethylovorans sp.]|uniref:NTP transferase domain-containing protein n=1 Tax=Methanomethylovorans sp. TaxID=2758717 RepID=UPI000B2D6688|nr:NTP transferase domain-containing protein [Methanomethylovorans sp.]